ncbi:hypothetical protein PO909_013015 [Leuciscus waleckii]
MRNGLHLGENPLVLSHHCKGLMYSRPKGVCIGTALTIRFDYDSPGGLRFFWDNKFDHAMVAFLDCVQQFKEEVEKGDTGFCLPYRMDVDKGKIEDTGGSGGSYSIKTQFNSEEQWTKALKFMLTNLKWGLAWVSSQFYNR